MKNFFHVFLRMFTKFLGERPSKLAVFLCMALFASTTAFAEEYITDVMVIGGDKDRVDFLKDSCGTQGWTVIDKDLNDNAGVGTDYVYLLYKKSSKGGGPTVLLPISSSRRTTTQIPISLTEGRTIGYPIKVASISRFTAET